MVSDALQRLVATEEIRQLAYSYAFAFDTLDWDLMLSLWVETETAEDWPYLDIHRMRGVPGRLQVQGDAMLFVGNHRVMFDAEDRARGTVYCHATIDRGGYFEQMIVYVDDYERIEGRWLFRRRNHLLMWGRGPDNPSHQPAANWPSSQVGAGIATRMLRSPNALQPWQE